MNTPARQASTRRILFAAFAGLAAGAASLGGGELAAALLHPAASPVLSVGSFAIDLTPPWLKEAVIAAFGTGDKSFLISVLVVFVVIASALAGLAEVRLPPVGRCIVALFGIVAGGAAVTRTGNSVADVAPSLVALAFGVLVLGPLAQRVRAMPLAVAPSGAAAAERAAASGSSRRAFLTLAGVWTGAGAVGAIVATAITSSSRKAAAAISTIVLPKPVVVAPAIPAGAELSVAGISPLISSNGDFYRIDISLSPPTIDPDNWTLKITGMVEKEVSLTYKELLALPLEESRTTLMCVSNEVGGDLIGTAKWLGYPIRKLLAEAKPTAKADMVLSSGADGFTAGSPLTALTDDRNAVLAVGMNGQVLPQLHGFPVRMVVPGLYGYVSATKWLTEIKVSRFDQETAYWTARGWSQLGPIKISSRIDVPTGQASVKAGMVAVAGVAWAQHTGIGRVQVQIGDGAWQDAKLAAALSTDVWRQWSYAWNATAGTYSIRVRATDANGLVQTAAVADTVPNGATGLDTVQIQVT